jgi:hypothetical protein
MDYLNVEIKSVKKYEEKLINEIKGLQININDLNKELIISKSEVLFLQNENKKLKNQADQDNNI